MTFIETFSALFLAQSTVLLIGYIFKKHIEPRLDKGHNILTRIIKKFDKWIRKKLK